MTYGNIKSHKKTGVHPFFRRYIFQKITGGRGRGVFNFSGTMKLKNRPVDPFKVSIIKAEYAKNVFGGHFPIEHNGVTNYNQFKMTGKQSYENDCIS